MKTTETLPQKIKTKNREERKKEILAAVGRILTTKGYAALKVNDIASMAGLDKKLIYRYFGSTEKLLDEYVQSRDFWSNVTINEDTPAINDGGMYLVQLMMKAQFDTVFENKEFQHVLLWRLSQQRSSLQKLVEQQEANGEQLFAQFIQPYFKENTRTFRAISAILISGLYYLNMSTAHNGSIFCGLDMASPEDRNEIKKAIDLLVEQTYSAIPPADKKSL